MAGSLAERARALAEAVRASAFVRFIVRHKRALAIIVIVAFFAFLVAYVALHPDVLTDVVSIGWGNLALLLLLYCGILGTHFAILTATIRLCDLSLPVRESFLLTVYSTVANFFGPLQSGPGVRAVYLRSRIGLRLRDFASATLLYYFVFGAVNASLLFATTVPLLSIAGVLVAVAVIAVIVIRRRLVPRLAALGVICAVTVAQILLMSTIYFVEINAVSSTAYSFTQATSYAASANLSLFVSITPGAIGIREAFLVFAQSLHQVPVDTIVAAGIVDRAFYVLFLGLLFIVSSALNLRALFIKSPSEPLS